MKKEKDVKVVEKLEDICVMEGIDFRLNQRLSKIEDAMRKEKLKIKKNERFNNILVTIAIVIALVICGLLIYMLATDSEKAINQCVENGHARQVCEKSILGN